MSIATVYTESKRYAMRCKNVLVVVPSRIPRDTIVIALFIVATFAGFGLGFLAGERNHSLEKNISITSPTKSYSVSALHNKSGVEVARAFSLQGAKPLTHSITQIATKNNRKKIIVASKNGGRYYLISCSGAKRIHKENKVWFVSASVARAKGYTPALHCPGI